MKIKIYLIATLLFSISSAYAQKELNLEDIWKNNAFGSRYVSGIQSLNDGLHYTTLVNSGKTQYIIKYQYKNGNAVDTIFNTAKADKSSGEIPLMTSYQFSPDEKKILLMTERSKYTDTHLKVIIWYMRLQQKNGINFLHQESSN
jgi:dipeptidyl-peptidase-4